MVNTKELGDFFSSALPFWGTMTDWEREKTVESSYFAQFDKGDHIHSGDECTGVIFVRSGALRVYLMSDEGKDVTLFRLYAGDVCMLSASCVFQSITFDVFVDAEERSDCCIINGSTFADLCERNINAKVYALESATDRFSDVVWVLQQILFMSMDKRLAIFLLDEAVRTGSETISLTHEQIAKHTGSAREVVSRMLKYFASEGLCEVSRKGIKLLDTRRLRRLTL